MAFFAPSGVAVSPSRPSSLRLARPLVSTLLLIAVAVGLQIAAGAYRVELDGYPDEPAHAVTGIMLDRYVRDGFPRPVREFFQNYYLHYPKVALGHWPPLLYMVEAAGTLVSWPSRTALLLVQAVLAGVMAAIVLHLLSAWLGYLAGAFGAAIFLAIPVVVEHTSMAMAEILLTLLCLCSTLAFQRWIRTGTSRDGLLFGLATAAAILTKGTGWCLGIMALAAIVFTGEWRTLRRGSLWLAALVIAVLCIPWQIATMRLASLGWENSSPNLHYSAGAALGFTKLLFQVPGWPITVLALLGTITLKSGWRSKDDSRLYASLWSLVLADWLFHVVVPAGIEPRKLILAVPALFILAGISAVRLAAKWFPVQGRSLAAALFGLVVLATAATCFPVPRKAAAGYIQVAQRIHASFSPDTAILVSGDEGALISELALLEPEPNKYIVRASKYLAHSTWNGTQYEPAIHNAEECRQALDSVPISAVVLETGAATVFEHDRVLRDYIWTHPADWIPMGKYFVPGAGPAAGREINLYMSARGQRPIQHLVLDMRLTTGQYLKLGGD